MEEENRYTLSNLKILSFFFFVIEKRRSEQELKLLLFIQQMLYIESYGGEVATQLKNT